MIFNLSENKESYIKNFPFSYYNTQMNNNLIPDNTESNPDVNSEEKSLKEKIESQIKSNYNLIIPAILIELTKEARDSLQLDKQDLKKVKFKTNLHFSFKLQF